MRYKGGHKKKLQCRLKRNLKNRRSSDCGLKLTRMKLESLVIVNQHVTVNDLSNFAHTAHHARRVVPAGHLLNCYFLYFDINVKGVGEKIELFMCCLRGSADRIN